MTRQRKTPRQRAEEALAVANRRVTKLDKAVDHQTQLLTTYKAEHAEAIQRRDYLAQDPALPQPTTTSTGATTP